MATTNHSKNSSKKRLALTFLPLLVLVAILALLISLDQARTYKEITVQTSRFYVPKTFLRDEQTDMLGMLRDLIGTFEQGSYHFSAYADEILPRALTANDAVANSSLIWTIGPARTEDPSPTGEVLKTRLGSARFQHNTMIADDTALWTGQPPYQQRSVTRDANTGLYKLQKPSGDGRTYALSNASPATTAAGPVWLAHCVELSSVRLGGPWGRCTQQFEIGDLLVQIHFDGRLVAETTEITTAILALLNGWRTEP